MMWKRVLVTLGILLWAGAAFGDIAIKKHGAGFEETEYYKGVKMAMVSDDGIEIIDAKDKTITIINPATMVYAHATLDEYKKIMIDHFRRVGEMQVEMMMAATGQGKAEAEESLKQQIGALGAKGRDVKVEKGEIKDIAGYPSEQYRFIVDGAGVREVWISPAVDALIAKEMGADAKKALDAVFRDMESEFTAAVKVFSGYDSALENAVNEVTAKGYIMKEEDRAAGYHGGMEPGRIDIATGPVDPSVFNIPDGYEKIGMAEFLEQEMMEMDEDYEDEGDD